MRYGLFSILLTLLAGLLNPLFGQQLIFKNYTINDGLVANSIRRVFQDSKGFLWIATWEGLSKYDGNKFTNYSTANGLSHNLVNDIFESANGRLYVATNEGGFDIIQENRIIQKAAPAAITVNRFVHFTDGKTIATTDNGGLQEFNNGKLSMLPKKNMQLPTYLDLTVLSDSFFIAVGERGIQLLNRNYDLISEIRNKEAIYSQFRIYRDSKERVFVGTGTGLLMLAHIPKKGEPLIFSSPTAFFDIPALQQTRINAIFEDADGIIWIGTDKGLVKISPDGAWQLITKKNGLSSDIISTIFQDKEKNIWFGTELGLSKLVTKTNIHVYTTENGLRSNNVFFLHPVNKEHLLVNTEKGAQVFNTQDGKFNTVTNIIDPPFYSVVANSVPPLVISTNKTVIFDSNTFQFKDPVQFQAPFILSPYCIISDKKGNFFLSDQHHLYFLSGKEKRPVKILENFFSVLLLDKKGYLWAATLQKGLYRIQYSFVNNKLTIIATEHFVPAENIRSLFEDSKGNIWVGTRYHGVYRFSKNGTAAYSILNIDQSKGLSSNWVKSIAETDQAELWVASLQGLDKLIKHDSVYRVFNFSRVNNFYGTITNMVTDREHSLWLATKEGMVHITDGEMEKFPPLPVYITKISSPDSVYSLQATTLNLGFGHNQLQFEFSSPGFINEKQLFYSYRLWGSADAKWSEASNQHTVSYASLQPGNYRFEVRTMGWDGNWGKAAFFEFTIKPPFWQTGWFLLLCLLLLFAAIYLAVRKRVQGVRNKAALKQQISETEMMALKAQMNPHFMFNCINSIDAFIHTNDKYNATLYLNKFAKLLRNILDSSKQNIVSFTKDIETLKLYIELEELRNDNKFKTRLHIDAELLGSDYKVPPLIIQPFVENAILHGLKNKDGNDGLLEIDIKKLGEKIEYSIKDNGIGRAAASLIVQNKESSYGMQLSYDRIRLFNEEQEASVKFIDLFDNDKATGTLIKVELKII